MVQMKVCQADQRVLDIYNYGAAFKFELVLTGYVMLAYQKVPNVERVLSVRRESYFNLGHIWLKKVEGGWIWN